HEGHGQRPPRGRAGGARRLHGMEVDLRRLQRQAAARADRRRRRPGALEKMLETAVVIVLDDARPQLEPVRAGFHAGSVAMGIPLHVTLLYPFAPPGELDEGALADLFGRFETFRLTLTGVATWPLVVYAVPEPRDGLLGMMHALFERYPEYPPYE